MAQSRSDAQGYPIQLRQAIARFLPTRGLPLLADHRWSDRLLVLVAILLTWSTGTALVDRFIESRRAVVAMYRSRKRPGRTLNGFMATLTRHSARLLALVSGTLRERLEEACGKRWRTGGRIAFGFDGTMIDTPRTRHNQKKFRSGTHAKCAPQISLGALIHLGSGLLWSWRRGRAAISERTLLRQMLADLPPEAILVADAGLPGYNLIAMILAMGHSILMRAGSNVTLLKKLGYYVEEKNGIVYLWPKRAQKFRRNPLILRQIVWTDGRNRKICLLTNLLTEEELSDQQAYELYRQRWGIELMFRSMKQTLSRRKMLSDSPAHAEVELDWTLVGLWMVGLLLWEGRTEKAPASNGFATALRLVRNAMKSGGDGRGRLWRSLANIRQDTYERKRSKGARKWPHKRGQNPPGQTKVRMATREEIRLSKRLSVLKQAA